MSDSEYLVEVVVVSSSSSELSSSLSLSISPLLLTLIAFVDAESLEVPEAPAVPPYELLTTVEPPVDELEELVVVVVVGVAEPLTITELPPLLAPLTTVVVAGDAEELPLTTTELEVVLGVELLLVDPFTTTELE